MATLLRGWSVGQQDAIGPVVGAVRLLVKLRGKRVTLAVMRLALLVVEGSDSSLLIVGTGYRGRGVYQVRGMVREVGLYL